jgi:polyphosphate kinase 2 (PPK2 family)
VTEREFWSDYMAAYEDMIRSTATKHALWHVVPADNKWFTRIVIAASVVEALDALDLHYPEVDKAKRRELAAARRTLLAGT